MGRKNKNINYIALVKKAIQARKNAYAPYSKFKVGATVLTDKGTFSGCNVENASYGLGICAERVALCKAISEGAKKIFAIAVSANNKNPTPPCGACRQFMREFNLNMEVVVSNTREKYYVMSCKELLPESFGPDNLRS